MERKKRHTRTSVITTQDLKKINDVKQKVIRLKTINEKLSKLINAAKEIQITKKKIKKAGTRKRKRRAKKEIW